jgi:hypothetical protein
MDEQMPPVVVGVETTLLDELMNALSRDPKRVSDGTLGAPNLGRTRATSMHNS